MKIKVNTIKKKLKHIKQTEITGNWNWQPENKT